MGTAQSADRYTPKCNLGRSKLKLCYVLNLKGEEK